jgi:hypothetical protein
MSGGTREDWERFLETAPYDKIKLICGKKAADMIWAERQRRHSK